MDNKSKMAVLGVTTIFLAASGFYYYHYSQSDIGLNGEIRGAEPIPTATGETIPGISTTPDKAPKPKLVKDVTAPSLTRTQAVAIFANTRIAFNEDCKMSPSRIYAKSGTTMMFDNRSRNARTFKLDGVSYTIPGYGFKLFQLKSTKLPHVVNVECGPNSGEIVLS